MTDYQFTNASRADAEEPAYFIADPAGPYIGLIRLKVTDHWVGAFGTNLPPVDLGVHPDRESAAEAMIAVKDRYRCIQLFDALASDDTIAGFLDLVDREGIPGDATIGYGDCGSHEALIEWLEADHG